MWVTNFTNRSAVALRMVTSLLFPRKQNINTELDAGGRRARAGAAWKMKMCSLWIPVARWICLLAAAGKEQRVADVTFVPM